jgi:MFS family permease
MLRFEAVRKLPRTVIVLGFVSFCNDAASDMVIPLIPILLASVLMSGPIALGAVEGIADAVASFLKLWSGRHSDFLGGRRKGLTVAGYLLSNLVRPLLGLAGSWVQVLVLRSVDRMGKGIRSAPRDALVADCTPSAVRGLAFGFHRALDNAGAVAGSLIAAAVLAWSSLSLGAVIMWSAVPGFIGVALIAFALREPRARPMSQPSSLPPLHWSTLTSPMRRYLLLLGVFTFARVSETFIVLRGHELGMSTVALLLMWSCLNLAKALTSSWGGGLADRVGRDRVMLVSWSAYALSFGLLSQISTQALLWLVAVGYGLFAGSSEGAERALIGDFSGGQERGTAYGWYNMMLGIAAVPAGVGFGVLWEYAGASYAFFFAAMIALAAVILLHHWVTPSLRRANALNLETAVDR